MSIIPEKALEQHVAILGKTRGGKTNTAKVCIEQLVAAGGRMCVLDPIKSDYWGLTSSADGNRPGLPFHIIGGPHGHVPLHASAGKAIGGVVASGAVPLSIIDMESFGPRESSPFFIDFMSTVFREIRGVLHIVIDEAHLFAPKERNAGDESMATYWFKRMASGAGSKGVRLIVSTQRLQELHNTVLSNCETLVAHRVTFPADQKVVSDWVASNGTKEIVAEVKQTLANLKRGEAWVCSGELGIFQRVAMPLCATYDNSRTPTADDQVRKPVKTAAIDLDKLKGLIGEAVKEAEANNPKLLRAENATLRSELAKAKAATVPAASDPKAIERAVAAAVIERDRHWKGELAAVVKSQQSLASRLTKINQLSVLNGDAPRPVSEPPKVAATEQFRGVTKTISPPAPRRDPTPPAEGITPRQQRFLDAAAALTTLNTEVSRETVAAWIGVHPRGGSVGEELSALQAAGYIVNDRGQIIVTDAGMDAAGQVDASEAIGRAKSGLSNRQAKFFEVITAAYPEGVTREQIAAQFNIHPRGGSLGEDLGRLVGRGLVDGSRGTYRARDFLFAGGAR